MTDKERATERSDSRRKRLALPACTMHGKRSIAVWRSACSRSGVNRLLPPGPLPLRTGRKAGDGGSGVRSVTVWTVPNRNIFGSGRTGPAE